MSSSDRFSRRLGFEPEDAEITVRQDAPTGLRIAVVDIAYEAGLQPTQLRRIVSRVLRVEEESWNWSDFPNVDEEVRRRLRECAWHEVYDIVEAVDHFLRNTSSADFQRPPRPDYFANEINLYFRGAGIGWQLVGGLVQARGPESFQEPVNRAIERLEDAGSMTARNELHQALQDLSRRPVPDLTGAIQHAMVALECIARDVCGDARPTLGQLLSRHPGLIPAPLDQVVEKAWGYASEQGRHLREGREPEQAEAAGRLTRACGSRQPTADVMRVVR
ncbi:MAG TPA: hypothetical protein VGK99_11440 [Acidobacteriota bacterium]|jgi:hypothetical protein|nr:hypothetical protein [Blastocatellia bacterium]